MALEGLPTRPDEVIVTTGAQQAIGLAAMLLGEPGQAVLVEEATYPGVARYRPGPRDAPGRHPARP